MVKCPESGRAILSAITRFINLLLAGCPNEVSTILFGGNLIALEKKSGDILPIAVGYTWRRIAAKCANSSAVGNISNYLSPTQLGVGIPGGYKAAVHAVQIASN